MEIEDKLYEQIISLLNEQNKTMKEIKQKLDNIEKLVNEQYNR